VIHNSPLLLKIVPKTFKTSAHFECIRYPKRKWGRKIQPERNQKIWQIVAPEGVTRDFIYRPDQDEQDTEKNQTSLQPGAKGSLLTGEKNA